jgi:hypothetical protein
MRIFLDANILFSAAKSDGAVRELLERLAAAGHECWADAYVVEEARRNLDAKAPGGPAALEKLLPRLRLAGAHPAPGAPPAASEVAPQLAEKDWPVLAAAIRLRCDALVTGDRSHFGHLYGRKPGGVAVHSPRSLAEWLLR